MCFCSHTLGDYVTTPSCLFGKTQGVKGSVIKHLVFHVAKHWMPKLSQHFLIDTGRSLTSKLTKGDTTMKQHDSKQRFIDGAIPLKDISGHSSLVAEYG